MVDGTDHLDVVDPHVLLRAFVVDEPENVVLQHRTPTKLSEEHLARIPRADDQGAPTCAIATPSPRLAHDPQREPHASDERQTQKPVDQQHRRRERAAID